MAIGLNSIIIVTKHNDFLGMVIDRQFVTISAGVEQYSVLLYRHMAEPVSNRFADTRLSPISIYDGLRRSRRSGMLYSNNA